MTVRKGADWGERRAIPIEVLRVPDDRALREWICAHRAKGIPIGDVAIAGGDLARTVGGGMGLGGEATYVALDVIRIVADSGEPTWGAAHVVARRSWWTGELVLAMNAELLGDFDVAPRAHPGDGLLDVLTVDPAMGVRTRRQARDRARRGAHLPHPQLTMNRVATWATAFRRPLTVWIDGVRWCQAAHLELSVEADAYHAFV